MCRVHTHSNMQSHCTMQDVECTLLKLGVICKSVQVPPTSGEEAGTSWFTEDPFPDCQDGSVHNVTKLHHVYTMYTVHIYMTIQDHT